MHALRDTAKPLGDSIEQLPHFVEQRSLIARWPVFPLAYRHFSYRFAMNNNSVSLHPSSFPELCRLEGLSF